MTGIPPPDEVQKLTELLAQEPSRWTGMREPVRQLFDSLAPQWEGIVGAHHLYALNAALERVPHPSRVLDLGCGTAMASERVLVRWPDATVIGADISVEMLRTARAKGLRARFVLADASSLPVRDGSFDLIVCLNMFPFFAEIARVLRGGGRIAIVYSDGENTPVYLPDELLAQHLAGAGFEVVEHGREEPGLFTVARRR
jgi:ubiquinone/menaquinone biosynthesis C-methylase UbiE